MKAVAATNIAIFLFSFLLLLVLIYVTYKVFRITGWADKLMMLMLVNLNLAILGKLEKGQNPFLFNVSSLFLGKMAFTLMFVLMYTENFDPG